MSLLKSLKKWICRPSSGKKDEHPPVGSVVTISSRRLSHSARTKSTTKSGTSSSRNSNRKLAKDEGVLATRSEATIEKLISTWNQSFVVQPTVDELLSCFASKDVPVLLEDGHSITAELLAMEKRKCHKSFPDLLFKYQSITETKPGRVLVDNLLMSGTHTGGPYGYAHFPAIPTTSKHVVNDPERLIFKMDKDGKIVEMTVIALGNVTGPPGVYIQIGGELGPPPPC